MEYTTENKVWKKSILEKAKEKQQALIDDFRSRIRDILKTEVQISEEGMDLNRQALESVNKQAINPLADQLNLAVEEMDLLNKIKIEEPLHDTVQFGSAVITDQNVFFVSVSLEEFLVDNRKVVGISTKAPIYEELKGKKAGDTYLNQTIKEVF
jgi:hypothetical protein